MDLFNKIVNNRTKVEIVFQMGKFLSNKFLVSPQLAFF